MKAKYMQWVAALAVILGALPLAFAPTAAVAADAKEGWYPHRVDLEFVKKHAVIPKQDGAMIIDSRPTTRKYDLGHIPTAVNIPDTSFEKMTDLLPKDKATLLIFYCEGVECMLSHKSAFKAEKLGYTNVKVYAEGYPEWKQKGNIGAVSVAYIKKLIDEKAPMTLIDSRPAARKYDKGHIPTAINIPDLHFDKMTDKLPADKAAPLYFYCEGVTCKLSSSSAEKAEKLGYSNVWVVPEGYPAWEKAYGPGPGAAGGGAAVAKAPAAEAGKEAGSITVVSFEKIMNEAPESILLVDVRDANEFKGGTFKGAINVPINELEKKVETLPADKPIVFFCGAGGRSGEAYDMVKLLKPALKTYFLNASIKWEKDGSYKMAELK